MRRDVLKGQPGQKHLLHRAVKAPVRAIGSHVLLGAPNDAPALARFDQAVKVWRGPAPGPKLFAFNAPALRLALWSRTELTCEVVGQQTREDFQDPAGVGGFDDVRVPRRQNTRASRNGPAADKVDVPFLQRQCGISEPPP